jgi:hypothetical protein
LQVVEAKRRLPLDDVGAAAKGLSFYDYQARPFTNEAGYVPGAISYLAISPGSWFQAQTHTYMGEACRMI